MWKVEEVVAPIVFPHQYRFESQKLGLKWPGGPPGTGKTSLVRPVVRECGAHLTVISPHSVNEHMLEKILREAFDEASSYAKSGKPSVVFIDEIDAICPRRDSRSGGFDAEIDVTTPTEDERLHILKLYRKKLPYQKSDREGVL